MTASVAFLADFLAPGGVLWLPTLWGQLGTSRSSLAGLPAGVEVHLGVDDDDVDILAAGKDMVETAESDVFVLRFSIETSTGCLFTPAVAAEYPLALLDEAVRKRRCRCIVHDC